VSELLALLALELLALERDGPATWMGIQVRNNERCQEMTVFLPPVKPLYRFEIESVHKKELKGRLNFLRTDV
jgi:hypothetical protein